MILYENDLLPSLGSSPFDVTESKSVSKNSCEHSFNFITDADEFLLRPAACPAVSQIVGNVLLNLCIHGAHLNYAHSFRAIEI